MVKCKLLKLNLTDLDTCKHPSTPHPPKHNRTLNKCHCARWKCAREPTHSHYCCCARLVWAPCILQPSLHPQAPQVQPSHCCIHSTTDNTNQTFCSKSDMEDFFFLPMFFAFFVFSSLTIPFILSDFSFNTKYLPSFYITCPGSRVL